MGIRIDGAADLINATDGSLTIEGQSINSTGIGTFSGGVKVGSAATIHSTGQFNIGVAATVFPNGNATFAGIVTTAQLASSGDITVGVSTFFVDKSATNVGVGTNVPYNNAGTNVHLHSANTTSEIRFTNSTTGGGNNGGTIQQGGNTLYVSNSESGNIAFENAGAERVRITSDGDVIMNRSGNDLASAHSANGLYVVDDDSSYTSIACANTGSGDANLYLDASNGDLSGGDYCMVAQNNDLDMVLRNNESSSSIIFQTAGTTERVRISHQGKLGIGTDNPYSALSIKTTAESALTGNLADHGILLHAPGATKNDVLSISASFINNAHQPRCAMGFISHPTVDPIEGYAGEIGFYTHDAADGSAVTPAQERVRINRVGRVGIGTTAPSNLLHTWKSTSDGIQLESPQGKHYLYAIESNDNLSNGTLAGELGIRGKNGVAISGNNGTSCQVHINSNGLCLGGTGSNNALDDYEIGSWTPVLNKSGDSGAVSSYTNQVGKYIKVGKMLWISFYLYKSSGSFGSLANQWYVSGVPFALTTQASAAYQFIPCGYFTMNGTSQAQNESNSRWQSNSTNGNTTITMYGKSAATNWTSGAIEVSGVGCLELA